ncbi:hypothetical protein KKG46_00150 [Patescibacteria group bacterium]|nr:hypothetical protein [Patescibacteria group bacterium]
MRKKISKLTLAGGAGALTVMFSVLVIGLDVHPIANIIFGLLTIVGMLLHFTSLIYGAWTGEDSTGLSTSQDA